MTRGPSLVRVSCVFYGAVGAVAWALAWWRTGDALDLFRAPASPWPLVVGAVVGVVVALASRAMVSWGPMRDLVNELAPVLHGVGPLEALVLALSSGLAEEAFFRGALQPWLGLVPAALVFGLAHVPVTRRLRVWPLFAFVVGLGLGWLSRAGGTWLGAGVAHAMVNYLNVRWIAKDGMSHAGEGPEDHPGVS